MSESHEQRLSINKEIIKADIEIDDTSPFSPAAYARLREKIVEHITQLVAESVKVSKRHQSDTVSAAHIERASEYLVSSSTRRIFKHLGTVGGILLGAAVYTFLSMATSARQFSIQGTLISATLGIVGAFLVALHMAKD